MGGTSVNATTPTQPTTGQSVQDWVNAMPQIYQTQMQYAPLQAQQQVQIAQQSELPLAQAQKDAMAQLYPLTSMLQENLATAANQGMNSQVPSWMKQQYQSDMNSQLGQNAASGIGADYASRGLMQQQQNWNQYYQQLGLSAAGRQPLANPQSAGYTDYMSGFTPNSVMSSNNQNYGTAGNIYGSQLGYNSAANSSMMNLIGSGISAAGNVGAGFAMSSILYKNRIKKWE